MRRPVSSRFPRATAYLAGLPVGVASHGHCRALEVHEGARRFVIERAGGDLPQPFATLLGSSWDEQWIPEALGCVAQMMIVDELGEAGYLSFVYEEARRVHDRPFVRHLMRLLSPSLLAMGGAKRWGAMHSGTTLVVAPIRKVAARMATDVSLSYPAALFPAEYCRALGEAFRAALDVAHARGTVVQLVDHASDRARFEMGWDR
jgi:hypothetical protein